MPVNFGVIAKFINKIDCLNTRFLLVELPVNFVYEDIARCLY